jgi:lipoate-protein ligase B
MKHDRTISLICIPAPMGYAEALALQHRHGAALEKNAARTATLIFLEHKPVYTLGRRTAQEHLPGGVAQLAARTGAEVLETDRGGSVTYHGPGQLTAYLLLNLQAWELTIHAHLDRLEEVAITTLAQFGVAGRREAGMTGVWVTPTASPSPCPLPQGEGGTRKAEKICAIGVGVRKWVTYHGLGLNVDLDLAPFSAIVPCGLEGKAVTSLAKVLGRPVAMREAEAAMAAAFGEVYGAAVARNAGAR